MIRALQPRASLAVLAALLALGSALSAQDGATGEDSGAQRLRARVQSLCTIETAGRGTTTAGYMVAARTVAAELERLGVQPGTEAGYLQWVPLARWSIAPAEEGGAPAPPELVVTDADGTEHRYVHGIDFDLRLARFGSPPPARDYRLVVVDSPDAMPEKADPDGALLFTRGVPVDQRRRLLNLHGQEMTDWGLILALRTPFSGSEAVVPDPFLAIDWGAADPGNPLVLRGAARQPFIDRTARSLRIEANWKREPATSANVVGIVPGVGTPADPSLADQVVVLIAHLDQLGQVESDGSPNQDRTYDGADDNASGVAALLEVARDLQERPPARTVLLLFPTGQLEEHLGVRYQLGHPSLPLERTIYALDVEELGHPDPRIQPRGGLWLTGWDQTPLGPAWQNADLPISMDERLRWHYQENAPTFLYVDRGIPGQRISSFGLQKETDTVRDEPSTLDYDHMAAATHTLVAAVRLLVDGVVGPAQ